MKFSQRSDFRDFKIDLEPQFSMKVSPNQAAY